MSWNYRVIRKEEKQTLFGPEATYISYEIHEVYYKKKNGGEGEDNIRVWSISSIEPYGEDLEELRWVLDDMLKACSKPVLYQVGNKLKEWKK